MTILCKHQPWEQCDACEGRNRLEEERPCAFDDFLDAEEEGCDFSLGYRVGDRSMYDGRCHERNQVTLRDLRDRNRRTDAAPSIFGL